jgi:heme/copper-type cytochrome/quinol oxidase subunit 3
MRKVTALVLLTLSLGFVFAGCEKTDYKHPSVRAADSDN